MSRSISSFFHSSSIWHEFILYMYLLFTNFSEAVSPGVHFMKEVKHNQISLSFFIFKKIKSSIIILPVKAVVFSGSLSRFLSYMGTHLGKKGRRKHTCIPRRRWTLRRFSFCGMLRERVTCYFPTTQSIILKFQHGVCFGAKGNNLIHGLVSQAFKIICEFKSLS